MKFLVTVVMALGMLGNCNCKRHRFGESKTESEHMYVWGGGIKASGEVGVKYEDGLKFVKDGNFEYHAESGSVKTDIRKDTIEKDTTTTTKSPVKAYSYSQDTVNQYRYNGPPSPYGYDSQPYGYPSDFRYGNKPRPSPRESW